MTTEPDNNKANYYYLFESLYKDLLQNKAATPIQIAEDELHRTTYLDNKISNISFANQ